MTASDLHYFVKLQGLCASLVQDLVLQSQVVRLPYDDVAGRAADSVEVITLLPYCGRFVEHTDPN